MGIFKKILQKKEKGAESAPVKSSTPKKKNVPGKPDPLAPLGLTDETRSPPLPSTVNPLRPDTTPGAETEYDQRSAATAPPQDTIREVILHRQNMQGQELTPEPVLAKRIAEEQLGPVPRRVRDAERALADLERTLVESSALFKNTDVLPRLKILLVETKIKLAEADIKISEAEMAPAGSTAEQGEIESRISQAEAKIGEAEKILSSLPVQGLGKGSLSRLKIGVAGMKIRLAEIQIALAGSTLEGPPDSGMPSSGLESPAIPQPIREPFVPSVNEAVSREIPEPSIPPPPDSPKEVKIRDELQGMGVPLERHSEPVRITEKGQKPVNGLPPSPSEQGERIILPDMENESSPFETGINLNRVHIPEGDAPAAPEPQAVSERVKIRSDERESAWVTEDGSLKIVSREKTPSDHPREEEKPRISIRQPEVEKVLIIEKLNREGIEQRKKGKIDEALQSFDRVLELDPVNEAALHNKGVALRSAGRYEEALKCFDLAQERDPDNPVILFNRGFCLGKLERFEEALKAFDRVLALKPDHSSGWFNKGKILQKMGRMEEAEEHLKKAQELGYH